MIYILTIVFLNPAPGPVEGVEPRARVELHAYDSRTECEITATSMKVHFRGARLRCVAAEKAVLEVRR